MAQCTAKSKQSQQQCQRPAMIGKTTCHIHGGKSLSGAASGTFKTGMYSKHLPARLAATYAQNLNDPELFKLNEEAALVKSRIVELIGNLDTGETGETWKNLRKNWLEFQTAIKVGDTAKMNVLMGEITRLINTGSNSSASWIEVSEQIESYRKLSETERKHMIQSEQMIKVNEVMLLIGAIMASVQENVSDRNAINTINNQVTKFIEAKIS